MRILSLEYEQHLGTPKEWLVKEINFKNINLLVGTNATGKTRTLNIIKNIAEYTYNPSKKPYKSGKWKIKFGDKQVNLFYEIEFKNGKVFYELLKNQNELLLERKKDGKGKIKAEKIKDDMLEFQISEDKLAIAAKRDKLQHKFLEPLFEWGSNLAYFRFGEDMGQATIKALDEENLNVEAIRDEKDFMARYIEGINLYGKKYIKSVIGDMNSIGYDIRELNLMPLKVSGPIQLSPKKYRVLKIKEEDIGIEVEQPEISQGMFRALSLIIQINYIIFSGIKYGCVLIDDIGEGLDFNRSIKLIKLLIEKIKTKKIQLIMTTNDRFVMNNTPLEYWQFLNRKGHEVSVINYENSKEVFNKLYKSGLSNFDFFSSKIYLGKEK